MLLGRSQRTCALLLGFSGRGSPDKPPIGGAGARSHTVQQLEYRYEHGSCPPLKTTPCCQCVASACMPWYSNQARVPFGIRKSALGVSW